MNNDPKLKDFVKRGTHIHPKHKEDILYLLIPMTILSCILIAAGLVGLIKLIGFKMFVNSIFLILVSVLWFWCTYKIFRYFKQHGKAER